MSRLRSLFAKKTSNKAVLALLCVPFGAAMTGCQSIPKTLPELHEDLEQKKIQAAKYHPDADLIRSLTDTEKELIDKLFDAELETDNVLIAHHKSTILDVKTEAIYGGSIFMHVYEDQNLTLDFSKTTDADKFGLFIRVLAEVWQDKNIGQRPADWGGSSYDYTLSTSDHLGSFTLKQQRAVLEDYGRRFLHADQQTFWAEKEYGAQNCSKDRDLKRIVEKAFPAAEGLRKEKTGYRTVGLTEEETSLALALFGDDIDPDVVVKHFQTLECDTAIAWVDSHRDITFWGKYGHSENYALDTKAELFGYFAHELAHIWQRQTKHKYTNKDFVNKPDKYAYQLDAGNKAFKDYGIEQQGAIIEDYSRYYLHPSRLSRRILNAQELEDLKTIVEDQFPTAKQVRLSFEQNGVLPKVVVEDKKRKQRLKRFGT